MAVKVGAQFPHRGQELTACISGTISAKAWSAANNSGRVSLSLTIDPSRMGNWCEDSKVPGTFSYWNLFIVKDQDELFISFAVGFEKPVFAGNREPAFPQDPNRGDIVLRNAGIQR